MRIRKWIERQTVEHGYPAAGPSRSIPVTAEPVEATLLFGGDLAFHRWALGRTPAEVFGGLSALLAGCDARFFNLESQFTARTTPAATIGTCLRADPAMVRALGYLGATAVTCANNHCLDFGSAGLSESLDRLSAEGVAAAGILREGQAGALVVPVNGIRIGLLAYTDDWNGSEPSSAFPRPVPHDPDRVKRDIVALRPVADLIVVQLHWGYEWVMYPMRTLRDWARGYGDAGADLVICHHAHVPMGIERRHQGVIAHGLGNLFFGLPEREDGHPFRNRSFVLRVRVSRRSVVLAEAIPVHTDRTGRVAVSSGSTRDRTLRGLGYLSQRLDLDEYLNRVERGLVATQGAVLICDLAGRVSRGDARGIRDRAAFLSRPRQRWLVTRLLEHEDLRREIGETLQALEQVVEEPIPAAVTERIARLERPVERWLARTVPIGLVP